ncbi:hypothetical protein LPJ56_006040 [Coemansia sp. RSA 2599]|nr:hypothetical protein LPJ56_006040 [Coemansia sp. RSA 2599]
MSPVHKSSPIMFDSSLGGRARMMMAPAVDEDESVNWADFTAFSSDARYGQSTRAAAGADGDYDSFMPVTADSKRKRQNDMHDTAADSEIDRLSERLEDLKE